MSVPFRFRGRGLDERVASDLERLAAMVQALQTTPILNQDALPKGQRLLTQADLAGLLGPRAQTLIGETTADPLLVTQPTGNGTVSSVNVSGGTTGLTTSGGPITTSGTITLAGALVVANGGTGATTASGARTNLGIETIATKKCNFAAAIGPTVNDDSTQGYTVGSLWTGTTLGQAYLCLDATLGAAVWARFI